MAKINDFSTALQVIPRNESSLPGEGKKRGGKKRNEEEKDKNVEKERAKEGGREREE